MGQIGEKAPRSDLYLREIFLWSQDGYAWTPDHWGVVLGLGLAAAATVLGLGLSVVVWLGFGGENARGLGVTEALLLFAAIPLALAGAFCLDRLEARIGAAIVAGPAAAELATTRYTRGGARLAPALAPPRYVLLRDRIPLESPRQARHGRNAAPRPSLAARKVPGMML